MNGQKKTILIFSVTYRPFIGGAEIAIEEMTKNLPSDFTFVLITARLNKTNKKEELLDGVKVFRVGGGNKFDKFLYPFLAVIKTLKLRCQQRFEFTWAVLETYAGLAALVLKYASGAKYLLTMQSGDSDSFIKKRTWFWQPLYRQIFIKADKIQTISQWLKQRAISYGHRGKIAVIPNGVDLHKFNVDGGNIDKKRLLEEIGFLENDKIVVTASRLVVKNGVSDLIKAMALLPDNFKLLIIGAGKLHDSLVKEAENLKLLGRVKFLGQQSQEKIAEYFKISFVFARPSLTEGFGNVFVEAMAAGLPVIGTSVGGIKDFLTDEETGLVCEINNPNSIAERIIKLSQNQQLKDKLINNGLALVKERYDWRKIAIDMSDLFKQLCE